MATPATRRFRLSTSDGPLEGEVRSGGGPRPALVLWPALAAGAQRLARAGFTVVSVAVPPTTAGVDGVLSALRDGELGPMPPTVALLGHGAAGLNAAASGAGRVAAVVTWLAAAPEGGSQPAGSDGVATRLTLVVPPPWEAGAAAFDRALDETIRWLATRLV